MPIFKCKEKKTKSTSTKEWKQDEELKMNQYEKISILAYATV